LRLRPTRIGFLVRPNDLATIRQVMQVCTCLWGGFYNPIIPVCDVLPDVWLEPQTPALSGRDLALGYIRFFEPDVFVEGQAGLANELGLTLDESGFHEPRVIALEKFFEEHDVGRPQVFGTKIIDVYRDLFEREFRFVPRHEHRVALIDTTTSDAAFVEAAFGGFPSLGALAPLSQSYIDAFNPTRFSADAECYLRILKEGFQAPLRFTRHSLKREPGRGGDDPALFVADPDSSLDLIDLWNLRLFHPSVVPVSLRWFQESRDFIAGFIKANHRPLPGNPYGVMITATIQFGRSISRDKVKASGAGFAGDRRCASWRCWRGRAIPAPWRCRPGVERIGRARRAQRVRAKC
jgi:hypothetical protein